MPNTAEIVSGLRRAIGDYKTRYTNVVDEEVARSNGDLPSTYYTLHMPIISGETIAMRGGRWIYTSVVSQAAATGLRAYVFDYSQGSYLVPTGAIAVTSGDVVYATYSYQQNLPFEYQDSELYEYVRNGMEFIQNYRYMGLIGAGAGTGYTISPTPTDLQAFLIGLGAELCLRKDREQMGLIDGISIREADLAIDTTKGSATAYQSLKSFKETILDMLYKANLDDMGSAGVNIDNYATENPQGDNVGLNYEKNETEGPYELGEGNE